MSPVFNVQCCCCGIEPLPRPMTNDCPGRDRLITHVSGFVTIFRRALETTPSTAGKYSRSLGKDPQAKSMPPR